MAENYVNGEFKWIHDPPKNIQKYLNQWKHQYFIEIIFTTMIESDLAMLIYREEK